MLFKQSDNIVTICINEEKHKEEKTYHCCFFKEFVAWFAACDDLPEEEEHVSAIESGDRQQVHHGEDDREEGCHSPEELPHECIVEDASDGDEAADALIRAGARCEDKLHLFPIVANLLACLLETAWYGFPEGIFLGGKVHHLLCDDANNGFVRHAQPFHNSVVIPQECQIDILISEVANNYFKIIKILKF